MAESIDRELYVGLRCSLVFGAYTYEAKIVGRNCDFGHVAPLDPNIPSVAYSWTTIARVMDRDGVFK